MPQTQTKISDKPLFRVWNVDEDRPAYLVSGPGLTEDVAQAQSDGLVANTKLVKVFDPETDE